MQLLIIVVAAILLLSNPKEIGCLFTAAFWAALILWLS
jgi:hypothetical protein